MRALVLFYSTWSCLSWLKRLLRASSIPGSSGDQEVPETLRVYSAEDGATEARSSFLIFGMQDGGCDYDAIFFGTPTRFGNMIGQIRHHPVQPGRYGPKVRWWKVGVSSSTSTAW